MKLNNILIIGFFVLCRTSEINCQDNSFNDHNGFLFSTQFMGLIDAPRVSPIIGYKIGRIVYFSGYENIKYSDWGSNRQGIKAGVYIYPYKNLRKVKVFYQSLISYKWHPNDYTKMCFLHLGSGFDFFIKDNISVGYDLNIGFGEMKDDIHSNYEFSMDWNSSISLKLFLFRDK
jgi:hypothetical protein